MSDTISRLNAALAGRYRIEREAGRGGMATVFVAADLRHQRNVALKVVDPQIAAAVGAERFLAEIRTTANLQHPHILPLFDSGEAGGLLYYVMPYVEGESLRQRLDREGQLPIDEAVAIATKVAAALQAAHDRGVVHRDIKPANILLANGEPLVADFGIALAIRERGDGRLTEAGLSPGTPHYMSPEQAGGERRIGPASDIWALGCVLYEMLVGEPPFTGVSPQVVLGRILSQTTPRAATTRPSIPAHVDATIARALERVPADRPPDAASFGRALVDPDFHGRRASAPVVRTSRQWRNVAFATLAAASLVLAVAAGMWLDRSPPAERPVIRSSLEPPPEAEVLAFRRFAISPDGRRLAFVAAGADGIAALWVQSLDAVEATRLAGTEDASMPFWSPDGRHIGFFADSSLKRVPAGGGAVRTLHVPNPEPKGGAWSEDGRIVFVPDYRTGLFEISADGGEATPLTQLDEADGELSHRHPVFATDDGAIMFLVQTHESGTPGDRSRIEVLEPDGRTHEILRVNSSFAFTPERRLLYWKDGSIWATGVEPGTWTTDGDSELVVEGVDFDVNEWAFFSVSPEGTLVHHVGDRVPWRLEWRDSIGRILSIAGEEAQFSDPELSIDGGHVTYVENLDAVWALDLSRGTRTLVTTEEVDHFSPTWSPDGEWIAYSAQRDPVPGSNLYRRRSTGLGERELLYEGSGGDPTTDLDWSPDGRHIAFEESGDLFILDVESREARPLNDGPGFATWTRFSPDSRFLAYSSDETERPEVYVIDVAGEPRKLQVSRNGGGSPVWSADGETLYFIGKGNELRFVRIVNDDPLELSAPETLFTLQSWFNFDIAPDSRFLISTAADPEAARNFRLTQNWPAALSR